MIVFGGNSEVCYFGHYTGDGNIFFSKIYQKKKIKIHFITSEYNKFYKEYFLSDIVKFFSIIITYSRDHSYHILKDSNSEYYKILRDTMSNLKQKYQDGILGFLYSKTIQSSEEMHSKLRYIRYLEKLYQLGSYKFLRKNGILKDKEDYIVLLIRVNNVSIKLNLAYWLSIFIKKIDVLTDIFINYIIYIYANKSYSNSTILDKDLYIGIPVEGYNLEQSNSVELMNIVNEKEKQNLIISVTTSYKNDIVILNKKEENEYLFHYFESYMDISKIHHYLLNSRKNIDFFSKIMSNKYENKLIDYLFLLIYKTIKIKKDTKYSNNYLEPFFHCIFYYIFNKNEYIKILNVYYVPTHYIKNINFYVTNDDNIDKYVDIFYYYEILLPESFYLLFEKYKNTKNYYIKISVYETTFYVLNQEVKLIFFKLGLEKIPYKEIKILNKDNKVLNNKSDITFNGKILDINVETILRIEKIKQDNQNKFDLKIIYKFY